ncbi:MAG: DNA repair protein RecO [Bacteroidia bacterium]|nr:DNA repair protein RecO [Bacteroidia bacterium]
MEIVGIVTRLTPFKEKDAIVNVISEERVFSFLARGVFLIASKNMASVQPFSYSRFMLTKGKDGLSLRSGTLIESFPNAKEKLESLTTLSFIGELTNKFAETADIAKLYPAFLQTLTLLNKGFHHLTLALLYFATVLKASGIGLEVTKCVISGQRSDIGAISYLDGGFVALPFYDALRHQKCSERKLKIIRQAFLAQPSEFDRVSFERAECLEIIKELQQYVIDAAGIRLKSLSLLEKAS